MSRIADQIGPTELNHKKTHPLLDYLLLIQRLANPATMGRDVRLPPLQAKIVISTIKCGLSGCASQNSSDAQAVAFQRSQSP